MQCDDVITNSRWRTDAIFNMVLWLYISAPYLTINATFVEMVKNYMQI